MSIPIAVAALSMLCFLPALSGSFLNWDDNVNFTGNPAFQAVGPEQIRSAFTSVLFGHYIPLTRLTWSANYAFGGLDPRGYHLVNLLLHGANALIFYLVARRLLAAASDDGAQGARRDVDVCAGAAVAALVFGVHPLRVEAVAWVTARADLLCATFALLATWAYLRAVDREGPARRGLILASAALLAAAVLSKGAALPLVGALLLLDAYPLRRWSRLGWSALLKEKIPLLAVTAAGAVVILWAVRGGAVLTRSSAYGLGAGFSAAAYSFLMSAIRFVWPGSLSPLYEMPARISPLEPRFGLAVLAVLLVTATLIVLRRRWPAGLATWVYSGLILAPTNAALRQGADLGPDRYSYLAGLGFAVLVGGGALGVIRLARRGALARPIVAAIAFAGVILLAGLGTASWSYSEVWRESESLWRWAVELDPSCSVCHGKLGESVLGGPGGASRVVDAEALFRQAIELRPDLPDAYFNLGTALVVQGQYAEAEAPLRSYMERAPRSSSGPERLGLVYLLERRYGEAVPLLREALTRNPDAVGLRGYLAQALEGRARELGRTAEADALLAEARALGVPPSAGSVTRP